MINVSIGWGLSQPVEQPVVQSIEQPVVQPTDQVVSDSNFNLGVYGSHNAAFAISKGNTILEIVELERFVDVKNENLWFTDENFSEKSKIIKDILNYFNTKYQVSSYDTVYWNELPIVSRTDTTLAPAIQALFPANHFVHCYHHVAHANSAFYQSPFQRALIVSFDGGGDDGVFNVYLGEKPKDLFHIYRGSVNHCVAYSMIGHFISEIKHEYDLTTGQLVYPGKLMGLACEGKISADFEEKFTKYFKLSTNNPPLPTLIDTFADCMDINKTSRSRDDTSTCFAATAQHVFEKLLDEELAGFLNASNNLPIVLTGGGALNIINNSKIANIREVFVPPNPNDCGIALGALCNSIKPDSQIDCTYIGPEVWDKDDLPHIIDQRNAINLNLNNIADGIIDGKIYGIVQGRAEHGPRALGNRSILASAVIPSMKDTLNSKIKGRESFRPFAPVVRLEDVEKYFNWSTESRHMSYSVEIKPQYCKKLHSVASGNGTARVQTVTREQNELLYDLLTLLHNKTGDGILLNTSFNLDGKPILNRYADALTFLDTKEIHGVIFEKYFIEKST